MKIPQSVRVLYRELLPKYERLQKAVSTLIQSKKENRWHYEGRIKEEQSFALKLETGRVKDVRALEDLFACTVVVENHARIKDAEKLMRDNFNLKERRPKEPQYTHLAPHSFDFDDLRLYLSWADDPAQKSSGLSDLVFEIQIKTFLQHAWGIATHDFVYKSDDADWPSSRIAFQVKAMLENAELSIAGAKKLTDSAMAGKTDPSYATLRNTIEQIKSRWEPNQLPKDLRRLAQNLSDLKKTLRESFESLWAALDEATAAGEGAKTLNLSPFAAVVAALIRKRGGALFDALANPDNRRAVFVPLEVDVPKISNEAAKWVIRPPVPT